MESQVSRSSKIEELPMIRPFAVGLLVAVVMAPGASAQTCAGNPVAVQILGSGNPAANPERASSGYLLWVGQQSKMMVDVGGGTYFRFSQSRATAAGSAAGVAAAHPTGSSKRSVVSPVGVGALCQMAIKFYVPAFCVAVERGSCSCAQVQFDW